RLLRDAEDREAERKARTERGQCRLEPGGASEERVLCRGRRSHVGVDVPAPGPDPAQDGRREEKAHPVEALAHPEARLLEKPFDLAAPESAVRPHRAVVPAEEPWERGDLENQDAARPEAPVHLGERRRLLDVPVAEDVDGRDEAEDRRWKR